MQQQLLRRRPEDRGPERVPSGAGRDQGVDRRQHGERDGHGSRARESSPGGRVPGRAEQEGGAGPEQCRGDPPVPGR
ncbi:hypothetical protein [Streptomyces fragilis]|uniref:Uncharacterized protein n=1 Tax=Streptomyces fragilis TaxID=67301 RepID=A0ABV2YRI5_9ACTN|nr:hypothetical protein [Streptomyces fragilis]